MLAINELKGSNVVLSGDTLLDPIYLAQIACMLRAFGAKALVNKVDYLGLQIVHGGLVPDDNGNAGIDADEMYQDEFVEKNSSLLKDKINPNTLIASEKGSLALTNALLECGVFELYNFNNNYIDGVCFLESGNPDNPISVNRDKHTFYGNGSLVSDVLGGTNESQLWSNLLAELPWNKIVNYHPFTIRQHNTRIAAVGRCARTKEPLISHNSWTSEWLMKAGLANHSGIPIKDACPLLKRTIISKANVLTVEALVTSLDDLVTKTIIHEAIEDTMAVKKQMIRTNKEDKLILFFNLATSTIPILGQIVTLCSYLYQCKR